MLDIANDTHLAIDAIRTDGGTQPRAELNQGYAEELAELLREGGRFKDPVIVYYDGTNYWLADGFHRVAATRLAGLTRVDADVRSGTHENAVEASCGVNATHGLRRTNEDKNRAVNRLLTIPKWQTESNVKIARQCGVTEHLVRTIKNDLPEDHPSSTKSRNRIEQPVERAEDTEECVILRTPAEVVEQFFADHPDTNLSNREIARKCGVTEGTVRNYKKELLEPEQPEEPAPVDLTPMEVVEQAPPEPEPMQEIDETFDGPAIEDEPVPEPEDETTNNWLVEDDEPEPQAPADSFNPTNIPAIEPEARPTPEIVKPTLSAEEIAAYHEALKERRQSKEDEREVRRNANRELIASAKTIDEVLATAKFSTIVVDPPWSWEDEGDVSQFGRGDPTYGTMTIDELLALPVGKYADDDCHMYLWITNRSLPKGFRLLDAWGFRYVTCVTWKKPYFGMGNYFRGQTEHLLFGVKGSQMLKRKDVGTVFDAPRGPKGHSSKPVEAYSLIESCSPGPYLELFARSERPDWTSWGAEV